MDEERAAAVAELAPRVFAACEVQWTSPGGHAHGISDNVDGVMRLLGRGCEAHLVWT